MKITEKNKNIELVTDFCKKNNINNIGLIDFEHKLFYAKYENIDIIENSLKAVIKSLKNFKNGK
jgi:hypothetical protein